MRHDCVPRCPTAGAARRPRRSPRPQPAPASTGSTRAPSGASSTTAMAATTRMALTNARLSSCAPVKTRNVGATAEIAPGGAHADEADEEHAAPALPVGQGRGHEGDEHPAPGHREGDPQVLRRLAERVGDGVGGLAEQGTAEVGERRERGDAGDQGRRFGREDGRRRHERAAQRGWGVPTFDRGHEDVALVPELALRRPAQDRAHEPLEVGKGLRRRRLERDPGAGGVAVAVARPAPSRRGRGTSGARPVRLLAARRVEVEQHGPRSTVRHRSARCPHQPRSVRAMAKLKVGDNAPDFALTDQKGKTVKLKELRGRRSSCTSTRRPTRRGARRSRATCATPSPT